MIRKVIASVVISMASVGVGQAQKFEFGVQAGANMSHLVYSVESPMKLGGYAGAFAQYRLGRSPWSLRLGINWENNNTSLRNLNLGKPIQQIIRYDMSMHHLTVPFSIGYTIRTECFGSLALTPRVGILHRWGLGSSGELTSFLLNRDNTHVPAMISVPPFEGARGVVPPTRNNITGTYRYEPYSATTFGLFVGLDVELDKHWQVNASYKFGSGHGISNNNLKERGSIWLNSLELGISYLF